MSKPDPAGGKLKLGLTALSSAAVLAVYSAGFLRTRAAAEKFAGDELPKGAAAAAPGAPVARSGGPGPAVGPAAAAAAPVVPPPPADASATAGPAVPPPAAPRPMVAPAPTSTTLPSANVLSAPSVEPPTAANVESRAVAPPPVEHPVAEPAAGPASAAAPAPAPGAPPASAAAPAAPKYKDGVFTGWGTSRHGDIEATVTVAGGRIVSAVVSQCWTRWSCSVIAPLPPQVPARQSAEVDYVSGATQSTYAFYYAVIEALAKAKN